MLREIKTEDFDALAKKPVHPDKQFAMETALEVEALADGVYEVTGWPSGDSDSYSKAADRASKLRASLKDQKDVKVKQRGTRLFVVKGERYV